MKTREIRDIIKNRGHEIGVIHVLEALNEELLQTRRDIREMGLYLDKVVDIVGANTTIAERMRDKLSSMEKKEDDLGVSTHSIGVDPGED